MGRQKNVFVDICSSQYADNNTSISIFEHEIDNKGII